ncbi:CopG family transcriptional regulator [Thiococcus pfennigii]|uniref:CopG family transcriptional regulator n=1 Tax=Thiococcus pfennigii TaxID=1057 RepID=UPI001908430D|nr:CopG family transcriptional regulator [Thiococcus pfennigii]MBK1732694.1 CopG family transcriptional regulator [Thiococcus pfennigii]
MTTSVQVDIPDQLVQQAAILVRDGWATDLDEILTDALRRYLISHSAELNEAFIREDVDWGLRGQG